MRRKRHGMDGQIKEQKRTKKPIGRQVGEEYKMYVQTRKEPEADRLMASLDIPLTPEQSNRIIELADYGWLRSDIAKEVGVPKTRVNHELIVKRRGGGAA